MSRVALSKKVRFEVFKRDKFECQYCGAHPPDVVLEVDHIISVRDGGSDDIENLITACFGCNRGKGAEDLTVLPQSLADKAAEVAEREEQISAYREIMQARLDRIEDDLWEVADVLQPKSSEEGLRRDWMRSIKRFNELLDHHEVMEAADIALTRKPFSAPQRFKYFCGICWNKIKAKDEGP